MRELAFIGKGHLEWRDADEPRLQGDGEALVRPLSVATCDLDRLLVAGLAPVSEPFPFGHECVAEVLDVGDAVESVRPGDIVSVPFQISCGECETCRRGYTGNCERVERMAMYGLPMGTNYGGFLSDAARVPFADAMLVPVPGDVEPASVASLSDNIPDAWRTVGPHLDERPGSPVLIAASGASIALYAVRSPWHSGRSAWTWSVGAPTCGTVPSRLGANLLDTDVPRSGAGHYPIMVDASGDVDGLACALRSTEPEGVCTSIGIYFADTTPVPLLEMYTKGIRFHTGRVHARPAMEPLMELVRAGQVQAGAGDRRDRGLGGRSRGGRRPPLQARDQPESLTAAAPPNDTCCCGDKVAARLTPKTPRSAASPACPGSRRSRAASSARRGSSASRRRPPSWRRRGSWSWVTVSRQELPTGSISHVTREVPTAFTSSLQSAVKVWTSRRGGSTSTFSPSAMSITPGTPDRS